MQEISPVSISSFGATYNLAVTSSPRSLHFLPSPYHQICTTRLNGTLRPGLLDTVFAENRVSLASYLHICNMFEDTFQLEDMHLYLKHMQEGFNPTARFSSYRGLRGRLLVRLRKFSPSWIRCPHHLEITSLGRRSVSPAPTGTVQPNPSDRVMNFLKQTLGTTTNVNSEISTA